MKKLLLSLLLILTVILIGGCAKKVHLQDLTGEELFTQEGKSYFVFIYKDDCPDCDNAMPIIENYLYMIKYIEDYQNKTKLYGFNLSNETNSLIDRKYEGENGQGSDGSFYVNDVKNWDELYIGKTAALISIRTRDGEKYAEFEAEGYSAIEERLKKHLG